MEPIDPSKSGSKDNATDHAASDDSIKSEKNRAEGPGTGPVGAHPESSAGAKPVTGAQSDISKPSASASTANAGLGGKGKTPPPGTRASKGNNGSGRGLAAVALIVAIAALGLQAWQWQTDNQQAAVQGEELSGQMEQLANAQRRGQQSMQARLEGLPDGATWQQMQSLAAELQRSQRALSQELDVIRGDARADWKLAEAEYLLRLASLRLLAAQDVRSARELLEAVDSILREQPDSGVFAVREALAQVQASIEALPEIDRSGIYLRLAALHEQVNRLVLLPVPEFDPDAISAEEEYEDRLSRRTRAERVLMRLERYVRVDFQRGKVITPLLDEAEMQRVRRTLQLTMEQAQWAALRGESAIYQASLTQAKNILQQFFELENPQVKAMQSQLTALAERQVDLDAPDLSDVQQDLAAYIQSRRSPTNSGEGAQ
ncbi:uroporphyrinogen-III C-methyltransferase [Halopseudomonas salina]|uniref:Heme biosynthesis operon protein HemX n=1 Tax=Halopseudomonas salina TaxID=1323744 RepID=A0ABQ1PAF4_9GAMM|nr:uroporphyrinogen-III C-methyltransferase [Halopseudomonas salina]GGC92438.1 heme biosynthesis operon protein HemX [Halopseudomonas salina]